MALFALVAFAAPHARGEGPSAPEDDVALRSGLERYGRRDYAAAIAIWETLLATIGEERGYKVLYNLGLAYQASGDATKAIERYRSFARIASQRDGVTKDISDRAADAEARALELERTHGALYVDPPKRGGRVLVRIDESAPRPAGYVVWLTPGSHTIRLSDGVHWSSTVDLQIAAGEEIHFDPSPPEPPPPPGSEAPPRRPTVEDRRAEPTTPAMRVYVGAAATVASFALPTALFFVADGKRDDADALGAGHSRYADARSTYETWRTAYYVSYAVPVALALTTAALWLFGSGPKRLDVAGTGLVLEGKF